jgi:hypothetical protein
MSQQQHTQETCPFLSNMLQISVSLNNQIMSISPQCLIALNVKLEEWLGKDIDGLIGSMTDRDGIIEPCELIAKSSEEQDLSTRTKRLELMVCRHRTESHLNYYLQDITQSKQVYNAVLRSPIPIAGIRKMPPSIPEYILDAQYILKDSLCVKLDPMGVVESTYPFHAFLGSRTELIIGLPITAFIHPEDHILLMHCWSESLKTNTTGNVIVRWESAASDHSEGNQRQEQKWVQIQASPFQKNIMLVFQYLAPLSIPDPSWSLSSTISSFTQSASTFFKSTSFVQPQNSKLNEKSESRMYTMLT